MEVLLYMLLNVHQKGESGQLHAFASTPRKRAPPPQYSYNRRQGCCPLLVLMLWSRENSCHYQELTTSCWSSRPLHGHCTSYTNLVYSLFCLQRLTSCICSLILAELHEIDICHKDVRLYYGAVNVNSLVMTLCLLS